MAATLAVGGLLPWPLAAQPENPVVWSFRATENGGKVPAGGQTVVELVATIEPGWHLYATTQPPGGPIATKISVPPGQAFSADGPVLAPAPRREMDPNFEMETQFYDELAVFSLPVRLAPHAPPGVVPLEVHAYFQTCNDQFCLPPRTDKLTLHLEATSAAVGSAPRTSAPSAGTPDTIRGRSSDTPAEPDERAAARSSPEPDQPAADLPPQAPAGLASPPTASPAPAEIPVAPSAWALTYTSGSPSSESLWAFLWLAATVGALSLLTPCVFPMVPITVSYFTNHASTSRRGAVGHAALYGLGIVLTFTGLGLALAVLVGATGLNQFAANPWVNLLITAIFLAFAMNLFGAYELRVPSSVLTRLDALTRREGGHRAVGTLLMGLTFTLTSFTCTAPFVGTLLVTAAQGDWQWPLLGMLAFSAVFASPFVALALAPQVVAQLPRSGGWLNAVKVTMGFLEVAAATKFLSNADLVWGWGLFTREVVLATWVGVAVLAAIYLLGQFRLSGDASVPQISAWRLAAAILFVAMAIHLHTGLFGRRLGEIEAFLPPARESMQHAAPSGSLTGELPWIVNDYDLAVTTARLEGRPLLIDFTGYTCTNCRWMEANMFPRPEVRRELEGFVRVRLYTDGQGPRYERHQQMQRERFGTVALPYYAILTHDERPVAVFPGLTRDPAEFVAFLARGRQPA